MERVAKDPTDGAARPQAAGSAADAGRKRAAVELIARHGATLRRAARRYSLCGADADDAYQRTMEILLTKAPSERGRELLGWSKTVVKHEALAIRRNRERLLGTAPTVRDEQADRDPVSLIPAAGAGPSERLERREEIARSREALQALKPAELRTLTLLAEGYSYAEIGEITGFSQTKVNRCLAEGRERFRLLLSDSEDGSRCREMRPLLSAFCDGETGAEETARVREHLRACGGCRATVRAYRAAPARVAALAPALPFSRSLLERAQELLLGIQARLPESGRTADSSVAQVAAAGGTRGAGMAALAKLAVCAGTVGGTAACVVVGVAPAPLDLAPDRTKVARIERVAAPVLEQAATTVHEPEPQHPPESSAEQPVEDEAPAEPEPIPTEAETGAVEYTEPVSSAPPADPPPTEPSSSSAAGEFGP